MHDVKTHNPGFEMDNASNFAIIAAKFYCPNNSRRANITKALVQALASRRR